MGPITHSNEDVQEVFGQKGVLWNTLGHATASMARCDLFCFVGEVARAEGGYGGTGR